MNKAVTTGLSVAVVVSLWAAGTGTVRAHERFRVRHSHIGFYLGSPWVWGPYPYFPPVQAIPEPRPAAQGYAEADSRTEVAPRGAYWYYCPDADGYYPYVQACPSGWMQVVPRSQPLN